MATRSQLAVPLSQNTAPIFKFDCLYTHDLVRKQKRWQDGVLAFHTFNKRVMVYDLTSNFIGDTHWRESDHINVGDDFRLDRGVLVEVGEARGRTEQDLSEIFAKKTANPNFQQLPKRNPFSQGQNARKPKSISAVLGGGRDPRAYVKVPPLASNLSLWSSPIDLDSPRPSKKPRLEVVRPEMKVLAVKATVYQVAPNVAHNEKQTFTKPLARSKFDMSRRTASPTRQESAGIAKRTKKTEADGKNGTAPKAISRKGSKTKPKAERKEKPKLTESETTAISRPQKVQKLQQSSTNNGYAVAKLDHVGHGQPPTDASKPRQILIGSKSKRKKLIFRSMSAYYEISRSDSQTRSKRSLEREVGVGSIPDPDRTIVRDKLKVTDRDAILISSQPVVQQDLEVSEDDDFYITPSRKRGPVHRKLAEALKQDDPMCAKIPIINSDSQIIRERVSSPRGRVKTASSETNAFGPSGISRDVTRIVEETSNPLQISRITATERVESGTGISVASDVQSHGAGEILQELQIHHGMQPDVTLDQILPASERIPPSPCLSQIHSVLMSSPAANYDELCEDSISDPPVLIPASPPTKPRPSSPTLTPQDDEIQISTQRLIPPSIQQEDSYSIEAPPIQQPTKTFNPLTSIPILNKPTIHPPSMPNQKPLPQFRPPRRTTRSTTVSTLISNTNQRPPPHKSLTTSLLSGNRIATAPPSDLRRTDSDEGAEMHKSGLVDYDDTGPWSREAFDLFGWTPDIPKGKVLGPVASRGCGCRAAAAAKGVMVVRDI